ncbi:putative polar amino acid ABC transporter inner membrane subunit [Actinacidiphila reveromycinica]|uniref:Putative polar amino acid ABC transporter inner membrane subunit n=1 Tax=Actinacidiphila reveromycinica TaxID=659352 RepID=A0A7U3UME0_9ACTN|nr:amino acid ABC transporter permease [Streptomyces sp. SN-593]BBA96915.1 putative polar amino acid ABC transporter inner membrane subunit [Streptomyces sp. SN-593]
MGFIADHIGVFGSGLRVSAEISACTFLLATLLGALLAVCRISPVLPLRVFGRLYVAVLRSIPLLVLLTLFVFGLPEVGVVYSLQWTAVTAMSLYWAAFFCEVLRAGVRAVPRGQIEAARALGLGFGQVLRLVVLPQAVRTVIQPVASLLIAVTLNSSLAAAVGVTQELTGQTELLDQRYAQPLLTFGAAAVLYVAIALSVGRLAGFLDRRMAVAR